MPEYLPTVGETRAYFDTSHGNQLGNPAKAAAAILTALDCDEPPLRLVLSTNALEGIRGKYEAATVELTRWEHLARTTDFDAYDRQPSPQIHSSVSGMRSFNTIEL